MEALLDVARGLAAPGARVHLALGTAGDRTDEILQALGEIAGLRADHVVAAHKAHYLRGRTVEDLEAHLRLGLARAGVADVASCPTELAGLRRVPRRRRRRRRRRRHVPRGARGDRHLAAGARGRTADDPDAIRRKVVRARGEHEAEEEITAVWEMTDAVARVERAAQLYAAHPGDARIAYEYAGTHDSAGHEAEAVPLYEEALAAGLREPHRHRAQVQLASSLRNLGRATEGLVVLDDAARRHPDSLGVAAFRALVQHDAGNPSQALADLLTAVAATSSDPDVVLYRRALTAYAAELAT